MKYLLHGKKQLLQRGGLRTFWPSSILPLTIDFSTLPDGALPSPFIGGLNWQVVTGKAVNTPTPGGDIITNGGFDSGADWNLGAGWSIGGGVAIRVAAAGDNIYENVLTANLWYRAAFTLTVTGGFISPLWGINAPFALGTGTHTKTHFSSSTGIRAGFFANAAGAGTADNVSYKNIPLASMLNLILCPTSDVSISVTTTVDNPCGVAMNIDNPAAPANGIFAWHNSGRIYLQRLLAGVLSAPIDTTTGYSYGAGKSLKLVKAGTSYSLYYGTFGGEAQISTTKTISDAGIIGNKYHGLFSTDPTNSFGKLVITNP